MTNKNPMCCGSHCKSEAGQVRVYPLGSGANLILCHACWEYENGYRRERRRLYDPKDFPNVLWSTAEVYDPGETFADNGDWEAGR